jgi:hypothetical protein
VTKPNYTHCTVLVDHSGSMAGKDAEATNGIKVLQEDQFALPGEFTLTIAEFDTTYQRVRSMITEPFPYVLRPAGGTALLDSVAKEIAATGLDLADLPEDQRPEHVIFVIVTDGEENSSTKTTLEEVKDLIQHQQDAYKWQFLFLGADTAAWMGKALGTTHTTSYTNDAAGTQAVYGTTSSFVSGLRTTGSASMPDKI